MYCNFCLSSFPNRQIWWLPSSKVWHWCQLDCRVCQQATNRRYHYIHTFKHTKTWTPAAFHHCVHLMSSHLREAEWDDHSLRWGAECRLEAQAAAPQGDSVWEENRINEEKNFTSGWYAQTACTCAHIKHHIPAFFSVCICFGVSELISARGSVQCACMNVRSLS